MEPVVEGVTFYVKYLGSSVVVILMILQINLKDAIIKDRIEDGGITVNFWIIKFPTPD